MRKHLSKKTIQLVGFVVVIALMTAGVAFAAPVLQPGVTSAPGMSGVCTDCHTYATPPASSGGTATPTPSTPPSAGSGEHEKDDGDKPATHKAKKHKKHKKAKHRSAHHDD
jgi:hypothetical protein